MISIIVPIYNGEKYVEECLRSIMNQSYKDIEVICVDDESIDKTSEIVEKLQLKDSRIQIIKQENKGVSSARNVGIKSAKGEYILFVDADDYLDDNCLQILVENNDKNYDMLSFSDKRVSLDGKIYKINYSNDAEFLDSSIEAMFKEKIVYQIYGIN